MWHSGFILNQTSGLNLGSFPFTLCRELTGTSRIKEKRQQNKNKKTKIESLRKKMGGNKNNHHFLATFRVMSVVDTINDVLWILIHTYTAGVGVIFFRQGQNLS